MRGIGDHSVKTRGCSNVFEKQRTMVSISHRRTQPLTPVEPHSLFTNATAPLHFAQRGCIDQHLHTTSPCTVPWLARATLVTPQCWSATTGSWRVMKAKASRERRGAELQPCYFWRAQSGEGVSPIRLRRCRAGLHEPQRHFKLRGTLCSAPGACGNCSKRW